MLASFPASMLNQKRPDLGILNRFKLDPSRFSGTGNYATPTPTPKEPPRTEKLRRLPLISKFIAVADLLAT